MTRSAIVTSLPRFGPAAMGSCLPPATFDRMETQITNIAARKIAGLDMSAKLEALHSIALSHICINLHILHCAELIGASTKAYRSSPGARVGGEARAVLDIMESVVDSVQLGTLQTKWRSGETRTSARETTKWYAHQ